MASHPFYAPDYSVKIEGLTLAADVRTAVTSLTYENNIETADMFTLRLNNAEQRFTDSALFDVGKNVEIHIGYVGDLTPMMLGEITSVSPSFPADGAPMLTITGYDKSHRMRHNSPPSKTFEYVNDSLVAAQIATENLLTPIVDPSIHFNEKIVQIGSDWALLRKLADRNYYEVFVHWDKLYFRAPLRVQRHAIVLEWGKNLSSFTPRLSTAGQQGIQVVRSYNYELAETIVSVLPAIALDSDVEGIIERLGVGFLEQLVQLGRYVVRGEKVVGNHLQAKALAKSTLLQILEGLYEASGTCIGIPKLHAGDTVDIRGIGKRFGGKYRLSQVKHTIDEQGYRTTFEVKQRYTTNLLQSLRSKLNDQGKVEGVESAIVKKNSGDRTGLGRIQVSIPRFGEDFLPWARVTSFMAGGNLKDGSWGNYFLPDIGDEVLVTFEQGDINKPVIVGGLWNGNAPAPDTNDGTNAKKFIKTKTGMQILFDETSGAENLRIKDKAGNTMVMNSKPGAEAMTLKDKAGATVTLNSKQGSESITLSDKAGSSIMLDSTSGNIVIEAKGNVVIKSGSGGRIDLNP